jgi:Tol biopolymer transport system component/predicted Ser/Thr protein kinase
MPQKGDVLGGRYVLLERIGSGGYGTVFRARDKSKNRIVAVKILRSELSDDPDYVRRFRREASIAGLLDSRHIVRIFEAGHAQLRDQDVHFLVMEYVEGPTLHQLLKQKTQLAVPEALEIAAGVARGLEEAHDKGVVHRDIKPKNIFIAEDETVKVGDFGIAGAVDFPSLRPDDPILGTPRYMSPEQCLGKRDEIDIRSDVYSLGVVLYEMIAGRPPFEGDSPSTITYKHIHETPVPLGQLVPSAPAEVEALVGCCLDKRPEGRFQSPLALRRAIEETLHIEEETPEETPVKPLAEPPPKRKAGPVGIAAMPSLAGRAVRSVASGAAQMLRRPARMARSWKQRGTGFKAATAGALALLLAGAGLGGVAVLGILAQGGSSETESGSSAGAAILPTAAPAPSWELAFFDASGNLWVSTADGTEKKQLTSDGVATQLPAQLAWSPDGKAIAFTRWAERSWELYAAKVDTKTHLLASEQVEEGKPYSPEFSWSADSRQVVFTSRRTGKSGVHIVDADGSGLHKALDDSVLTTAETGQADWSHFGLLVRAGLGGVFSADQEVDGIYLVTGDSTGVTKLTDPGDFHPKWSPDGTRIAVVKSGGSHPNWLCTMLANGTDRRCIEAWFENDQIAGWLPGSSGVVFTYDYNQGMEMGPFIGLYDVATGQRRQLGEAGDQCPSLSPSGLQLAFVRSGSIWVMDVASGADHSVVDGTACPIGWGAGSNRASVTSTPAPTPTATRRSTSTPTSTAPPAAAACQHWVEVFGTRGVGLNVHESPGLNTPVGTPLPEGFIGCAEEGPTQADGYQWWKIQDRGWVADTWLRVATGPPSPASGATPASSSGRIVFTSKRDGNEEIYLMNGDGSGQTNLTINPASDAAPVWSPDGSEIAFVSNRDGDWEIYVMNADGSQQTRLTNDPGPDSQLAWSPDGSEIAFVSGRDGNHEIYTMNADGSDQARLTNDPAEDWGPVWSPDGSHIGFASSRDGNQEVYLMKGDGSQQTNLTNDPGPDAGLSWSPDGKRIAFFSTRGGNTAVYLMNTDGTSVTQLTSGTDDNTWPIWSPDGSKIVFAAHRDANDEIYVINADGSAQAKLTGARQHEQVYAWSQDGSLIAFTWVDEESYAREIYVMNADGSAQTNVTSNPADDSELAWSP